MSGREQLTGRILHVWEDTPGTTLTADAMAGTTVLTVDDVSPFNGADSDDGPGGWLQVGDQVVQYVSIDDDASTITLAAGLATTVTVASENGEVLVWNDLYGEVDSIQRALVRTAGSRQQADPINAVVGDGVEGLANGDRGGPGENCVLERDGDEWKVIAVRGRPTRTRGRRYEAKDSYTLTSADITAGKATISLTERPITESLIAFYRGWPQRPTNYTINYDAQTITWQLSGFEKAGHVYWVHYAYLKAIVTPKNYAYYPDVVMATGTSGPYWYYRFESTTTNTNSGTAGGAAGDFGGSTPVSGLLLSPQGLARYFNGTVNGFGTANGYANQAWGSIAAIVSPEAGQAGDGIIVGSMGSIAASHAFFVGVDSSGHAVVQCYGNNSTRLVGAADLRGSKHHIVATFNETTFDVKLYVDGVLAASGNNGGFLTASSGHMSIGYNDLGPDRFFKGTIDEPAYWNGGYVLTAQQVSDLYNSFAQGLG